MRFATTNEAKSKAAVRRYSAGVKTSRTELGGDLSCRVAGSLLQYSATQEALGAKRKFRAPATNSYAIVAVCWDLASEPGILA